MARALLESIQIAITTWLTMIVTKEQLEAHEQKILAPYACKSSASKGRLYPDTEDRYRTAFQRDRDRILHTSAFRRLEYKTQVFVNYEGDYYRTRLTHTLEVAQIGRSLARALGANEDLVEGICLAHDLGHSPFGHAGEETLNRLMEEHGGFNHNMQTYRIVTELEERYPDWPGLNLTHELREGIAKHESKYDFSKREGFDPKLRGTIEAQIADISDGLAYNAHDVDDGLRAGLLTPEQLETLEVWQTVKADIGWDGKHFDDSVRHRMIRRLIGMEINDVIDATHDRLVENNVDSVEALQRLPDNVICSSDRFSRMNDELKTFLYANMYYHYRVSRMSQKASHFLTQLFEAFVRAPLQLPPDVQHRAEKKGVHRAVTDYLAGMTDRYALEEWQRLFDPFTRP